MIELRPYQQELYDKINICLETNDRVLVQAETGFGKSILIGKYASELKGRTLILTHRIELLNQNAEWINDLGILTSKLNQRHAKILKYNKNVIAMVQTVVARFGKYGSDYLGEFDNIIIDEAHNDYFKTVYEQIDFKKLIGLTATPIINKSEKRKLQDGTELTRKLSLADEYEVLVQGIKTSGLIELGFLTQDRNYQLTPPNLDKLKKSANNPDGYTSASLTEVFGSHASIDTVLKAYKDYGTGLKTMIFNPTTKVNLKVYEAFVEAGYGNKVKMFDSVNSLDGENREGIVDWFKNTDDAILLNVGVFTTGFNVKDLRTIIYNKATQSLSLFLQSIGRGGRIFPNKFVFEVVDLGLNLQRFGEWSKDRDWSEYFKKHVWKTKNPTDVISIWECEKCGGYNQKGTFYNFETDRIECGECGHPKSSAKDSKTISGEIEIFGEPKPPTAFAILSYINNVDGDANLAFLLLERRIIDLFHKFTSRKHFLDNRNRYIERVIAIYRPIYFAIINSDLKGKNKTLKNGVSRIINKLDKHYE
tara:strand:+ start:1238 stop:2839 length:1602 start_codon:yes stop_codon:yes gene_type:complete